MASGGLSTPAGDSLFQLISISHGASARDLHQPGRTAKRVTSTSLESLSFPRNFSMQGCSLTDWPRWSWVKNGDTSIRVGVSSFLLVTPKHNDSRRDSRRF